MLKNKVRNKSDTRTLNQGGNKMDKHTFEICDCDYPLIHGYIYLANGRRSNMIISQTEAEAILGKTVEGGHITTEEKDNLLQQIIATDLPKESPDEATIKAANQKMTEMKRQYDEMLAEFGIPKDDTPLPTVSSSAPK